MLRTSRGATMQMRCGVNVGNDGKLEIRGLEFANGL